MTTMLSDQLKVFSFRIIPVAAYGCKNPFRPSQRQAGYFKIGTILKKNDSQAPLRHTKLLATVASSRTWRGSRGSVAQDPAIKLKTFLAERVGFEPTVRLRTHAFQACTFNRSVTSPHYLVLILVHPVARTMYNQKQVFKRAKKGFPSSQGFLACAISLLI